MFTSAIKKQTSDFCSISLNSYIKWYFKLGNLESWKKKSKKESNYIVSLYC